MNAMQAATASNELQQ